MIICNSVELVSPLYIIQPLYNIRIMRNVSNISGGIQLTKARAGGALPWHPVKPFRTIGVAGLP
jgi:hypothetical protein